MPRAAYANADTCDFLDEERREVEQQVRELMHILARVEMGLRSSTLLERYPVLLDLNRVVETAYGLCAVSVGQMERTRKHAIDGRLDVPLLLSEDDPAVLKDKACWWRASADGRLPAQVLSQV